MKSTLGMRICDNISRISAAVLFISLFKEIWYLSMAAFVVVMVSTIVFIVLTIMAMKRFRSERH